MNEYFDVKIKLIKEEMFDLGNSENQSVYWIFKNSDWSKLKLTLNFHLK